MTSFLLFVLFAVIVYLIHWSYRSLVDCLAPAGFTSSGGGVSSKSTRYHLANRNIHLDCNTATRFVAQDFHRVKP